MLNDGAIGLIDPNPVMGIHGMQLQPIVQQIGSQVLLLMISCNPLPLSREKLYILT